MVHSLLRFTWYTPYHGLHGAFLTMVWCILYYGVANFTQFVQMKWSLMMCGEVHSLLRCAWCYPYYGMHGALLTVIHILMHNYSDTVVLPCWLVDTSWPSPQVRRSTSLFFYLKFCVRVYCMITWLWVLRDLLCQVYCCDLPSWATLHTVNKLIKLATTSIPSSWVVCWYCHSFSC